MVTNVSSSFDDEPAACWHHGVETVSASPWRSRDVIVLAPGVKVADMEMYIHTCEVILDISGRP